MRRPASQFYGRDPVAVIGVYSNDIVLAHDGTMARLAFEGCQIHDSPVVDGEGSGIYEFGEFPTRARCSVCDRFV